MKVYFWALCVSISLLSGCSVYEEREPDAYLTQMDDGTFEIEVRYHGSAYYHSLFPPFPVSYHGSWWLYLKTITGSVPGADIFVTEERRVFPGFPADRYQKGFVSFQADQLNIALEGGKYYSVFPYNGQYRIVRVTPNGSN